MAAKRYVPPVTPKPTYGAGGKKWTPPKVKEDNPIVAMIKGLQNAAINPRTGLGRSNKFVKGGYTKGR